MSQESRTQPTLTRDGFVSFRLGDLMFGVPVLLVREINPHAEITPIRTAPAFVRGLVNVRGQIVTVIDLGLRLGLGRMREGGENRLVILKSNAELRDLAGLERATSDENVGLLVDEIDDVVHLEGEGLEPAPANLDGVGAAFVAGLCTTAERAVAILDTEALLSIEGAAA